MFRKLQERLTAAANATGLVGENDVSRLTALGFTPSQAQSALQTANGDVDRAAELLLQQGSVGNAAAASLPATHTSQEADDLQRALLQSMMEENARPQRTAAMVKAAEAAERRAAVGIQYGTGKNKSVRATKAATTTKTAPTVPTKKPPQKDRSKSDILRAHHPDVQLVPKLQDKSVEERILRTADRMKSHPAAVDTLTKALQLLQKNPDDPKYRQIDTASPGYQRSVAPAPGALDFLKTMGFAQEQKYNRANNTNNGVLILHRPLYDPALVYLGLSALQQTQLTTEYINAKLQLNFQKELEKLLQPQQLTDEQEKQRRAQLSKQLPKEPPSGALLQICLGSLEQTQTIRRRFDGDDTVADLLNWLGATKGTPILDKVLAQEWCLVDLNRNPVAVLSVDPPDQKRTLQYVGCWPAGRLELRPTALVATAGDGARGGESRALASAASSDSE